MRTLRNKVSLFVVGVLLICGTPTANAADNVSRIIDGDTIQMKSGERVRLIQIDTPELTEKECFGVNAKTELSKMLDSFGKVQLIADPKLDNIDRYGRSLRYLFLNGVNVNLKLVEIGAAAPYFYRGEKGMYSKQLMDAAYSAKKNKLGLWKFCPRTTLEPNRALTTK